jgi:hypothetical protein
MANNPFFTDAVVIAMMTALTGSLPNSGKLELYTGTQPTDANTAIGAQVLLVTLTLNATAFGTPVASGSAGSKVVTATAGSITSGTAVATGTATWFRCFKSDGTTVLFDGSVGTSGCDLNLNTTAIVSGGTVAATALTITQTE